MMKLSNKYIIVSSLVLAAVALAPRVKADDSQSTQAQLKQYQTRLDSLSDRLAQNTIKATNLSGEITARKAQVAAQLRSAQSSQENLNGSVFYQVFFRGQSLAQAFALATIVRHTQDNVNRLQADETSLKVTQQELEQQQKEASGIIDTLNTKFQAEIAAEEQAKQDKLAELAASQAKPEAPKLKPAKAETEMVNAPTPPPSSTDWSAWTPDQAAQYVASQTGVPVSWWLQILYRESGGNATITNSIGCFGYYQMNGPAHGVNYSGMTPQQYLDAVAALYRAQGQAGWAVS